MVFTQKMDSNRRSNYYTLSLFQNFKQHIPLLDLNSCMVVMAASRIFPNFGLTSIFLFFYFFSSDQFRLSFKIESRKKNLIPILWDFQKAKEQFR